MARLDPKKSFGFGFIYDKNVVATGKAGNN